ncbi:hypothetical protein MPY17_20875 [Rhodococcus opacus]|uniref:hypothetical protein n=1 Tax=Rhodococcus opacus TaxID=37919 RepID=UPI001FF52AB8|nr:hypothetical protein [Rhodococcus opacus]UOT01459.1 hypothetical protein MPY17_20875 [Rhodococcus opacus]
MLREQCPNCGFHFPYMTEQESSFGVFKDLAPAPAEAKKGSEPADKVPAPA